MNKIELNTLTQVNNNERNFLSALNDNLKRIQAAINDTLSRSGVLPNQMEEVLDMNGKRIVNVGPAVNPTDVVTRQDIQNIIDAANEAIAQLDRLVEDGKIALMTYASEYIYPTCTAAVDACQLAQRKSEDAQGAAEAARDALLLNADYQAIVANLTTILALVNDITNLDAIAADLTNIDTVAGISSAVSAVADNAENINAVNANKTNIDTVAGDKANIDTVAGNTSNINTVAGISSAVTTLAGISATLTALNNNLTAINSVYDDLSKIESVYTALPEVEAVYDALSDIGAVADALTAISSVAAALTTLANIEDNLTTLLAVGADLTNLDSIAADLTNLDSIANNLTEILQASTYASQAAASASNAQIWAEGTDQQVVPLGGQHSAKVWAQYIEEIIAGTRIYGGTFDSTTATATLTSSAKAKLGVTSDTIVLTNDSTAITGYGANEGIEYYVAVEGTFASLTLHEGDILWSTGSAWKKIDNAATEIPDATESVKGIAALATTAEAEAGLNDTKVMTPLKTKQAIAEFSPELTDIALAGTNVTFTDPSIVNYTVIGSPTISGSVVSGFSITNYLKPAFSSFIPANSWEICFKVTTGNDVSERQQIFQYAVGLTQPTRYSLNFWACPHFGFNTTYDGTSFDVEVSGTYTLLPNTAYWIKMGWTGTEYYLKYSLNGTDYTDDASIQSSTPTYSGLQYPYIGCYVCAWAESVSNDWPWGGSIDLSECYITSNGIEVWRGYQPADKITINATIPATYLQNTATVLDGLTILGTATSKSKAINIGDRSVANQTSTVALGEYARAYGEGSAAIGCSSVASDKHSLAVGYGANARAKGCVQIGHGENSTDGTMSVALSIDGTTANTVNYELLNSSGKVPTGRYIAMTGADGTNAGTIGAVPAPAATDNTKFLRGDGTWAEAASVATYDSTTKTIQL